MSCSYISLIIRETRQCPFVAENATDAEAVLKAVQRVHEG